MPDAAEKTAIWAVVVILVVIAVVIGFGLWGFVQFIQWLTSK